MSASCTFTGIDEMVSNIRLLSSDLHDCTMRALIDTGNDILTDSRDNYVPYDQGELRDDSGVAETDDEDLSITIWYGDGPARAYALSIHETPSSHDPLSWKQHQASGGNIVFKIGGPKYLEKPLFAAVNGMAERIAEKISLRDI